MKKLNKIYKIILLAICLCLFGCIDQSITAEEYFDFITLGISDVVTNDLDLMDEIDGIAITYESSNVEVLTNDGKVYPKDEDVKVDLYIIITLKGEEHFTVKTITVKGLNNYDYSADLTNFKSIFDSYDSSKYAEDNYKQLEDLYEEAINKIKASHSSEEALSIINSYKIKFDSVEKNISIEDKLTEIEDDLAEILVLNGNTIYGNINLKTSSLYNSVIIWSSSNENILSNSGVLGEITEKTRCIFIELLSNPALNIIDIEKLAEVAHKHNIPLIVDNTIPTPYLCKPFEWGADIVVHSTTKYISGHGNAMGGAIVDSGNFDWKASGKFPELTTPDESYHGVVYTESFGKAAYHLFLCRKLLYRVFLLRFQKSALFQKLCRIFLPQP